MGCYALQPAETGIGPLTSKYRQLQATNCNPLKPQKYSPQLHQTTTYLPTRVFAHMSDDGILQGMPDSTTIKVSVRTRDALRRLAQREGLTFDAQIEKLVRRERRRIIGAQLASAPLDADDEAVLNASASDVADASG